MPLLGQSTSGDPGSWVYTRILGSHNLSYFFLSVERWRGRVSYLSIQTAEAGLSRAHGQPWLYSEMSANLGYMRPSLQQQINKGKREKEKGREGEEREEKRARKGKESKGIPESEWRNCHLKN